MCVVEVYKMMVFALISLLINVLETKNGLRLLGYIQSPNFCVIIVVILFVSDVMGGLGRFVLIETEIYA